MVSKQIIFRLHKYLPKNRTKTGLCYIPQWLHNPYNPTKTLDLVLTAITGVQPHTNSTYHSSTPFLHIQPHLHDKLSLTSFILIPYEQHYRTLGRGDFMLLFFHTGPYRYLRLWPLDIGNDQIHYY